MATTTLKIDQCGNFIQLSLRNGQGTWTNILLTAAQAEEVYDRLDDVIDDGDAAFDWDLQAEDH